MEVNFQNDSEKGMVDHLLKIKQNKASFKSLKLLKQKLFGDSESCQTYKQIENPLCKQNYYISTGRKRFCGS
jgi:hypothetical protein